MKEYNFSVGKNTATNAFRRLIGFIHNCGFREGDFKINRFEDNEFVVETIDEDAISKVIILWDHYQDNPEMFATDQNLVEFFTANPMGW